jgi:transposase
MQNKTRSKIRFKQITSQQSVLFPSNIGDKIGINHPVRIVSQIVDGLKIDNILSTYKGGGTSSYHPRVMLKILFYSYLNNIYSCRKIARQLEENIYYMWISGNNTPNFRTINDFRGKKLKGKIQEIFSEFVRLMEDLGYVSLDVQYVDGTKIEAAANKYTFVWRKSTERNKAKLESRIDSILKEIDQSIESDDLNQAEDQALAPVNTEKLSQKIAQLNQRLELLNKSQQKQLKKLVKEDLPKLKEYERQLEILGNRNSYSKTDNDATFMRMKEDHMQNGQLKPAYNVQISTENQIVTNYSVHQRPGDTATLVPHLDQFKEHYEKQSTKVVADSGYGSEQNYKYAENQKIEAYIKYNYFHKEQSRKYKENAFLPSNLFFNEKDNYFVCPMGQHINFVRSIKSFTELGYESEISIYVAQNCSGCPLHTQCHTGKDNRKIEVNHSLNKYRNQARERLMSEEGLRHRSQRPIEPEAVFGQIKFDNKFNRFTLKGLEKVEVEFGLIVLSHNLRKMALSVFKNLKSGGYQHFFWLYQQFFGFILSIFQKKNLKDQIYYLQHDFVKMCA